MSILTGLGILIAIGVLAVVLWILSTFLGVHVGAVRW